jgi:hypothetical protein
MFVKPEKIEYGGWPNCYRLANTEVELVATTDVGPRLIRFGFVGQRNEFKEFDGMMGQTGGDEWRIYGGHRLWHAPEEGPRTYAPDNDPVAIEEHGDFIRLRPPVETSTGLQKEYDVYLDPQSARARIVHRLINRSAWGIELSPWSLSVMAAGGHCIFPLPPRGSHPENLQPANTLTLWKFTDMSDPRWTWGRKYIQLRQDAQNDTPQKVGALLPDGWAAYWNNGHLFVKKFDYVPGASYADLNANFETFTNATMLEVETLGPLQTIAPGGSVEHVERWGLFRDVPAVQSEADIDTHLLPLVNEVL